MNLKKLVPWSRRKEIPVRREEADPFLALKEEMDNLFEEFSRSWLDFPFSGGIDRRLEGYVPKIDVSEDGDEILVTAELPGIDEKDIDVSLTRDALTIKGEKKISKEDKGKDYYRMERSYGAFHRTIPLPEGVDTDKVKATFKNGVLTVTLPKTAEAKERKKIPVSTS